MRRLSLSQFATQKLSIEQAGNTLGGATYNSFCDWYMNIVAEPAQSVMNVLMAWDSAFSNVQIEWDHGSGTMLSITYG